MILSSVPAFGRRMGEPAFTSSEIKVYPSNSAKLWRVGALGIGARLTIGISAAPSRPPLALRRSDAELRYVHRSDLFAVHSRSGFFLFSVPCAACSA